MFVFSQNFQFLLKFKVYKKKNIKSCISLETIRYLNVIYIPKFCHQFKVMGCLLAREIKKLKNTFQVNHSVVNCEEEKKLGKLAKSQWKLSQIKMKMGKIKLENVQNQHGNRQRQL
jgi:hypothetical protein